MKNIAICDDIPEICEQMNTFIQDFCRETGERFSVFLANDAKALYEIIQREQIDLLFLDIELPKINGIEIGNFIREKLQDDDMQIVYVSAIKDYSMELFPVRPNNFLIKPFTKEQIFESLKTALRLSDRKEKTFKINVNGKEVRQKTSDIIYFESSRHKIKMVTTSETIEFYSTMKDLYQEFKNSNFAVCHNSYLVNIEHIIEYNKEKVKMSNDTIINISRSKKDEFLEQIARFDLS